MFAEKLKGLRIAKDITQKDISEIFCISQSTIAMWETGKREPDYETIIKIANYFEVTIDYLLGNSDEPTPVSNLSNIPDDEVWELRREMAERPEMKTLFSLAKTAKPDDVRFANDMLMRFKRESGRGAYDE
jgi:transcriptional regulator with XRE-family HTH domain